MLIIASPRLGQTAELPPASADRDLLIRMDQRLQQLDRQVPELKSDLLRALDLQKETLGTGQQAVRIQLEGLERRVISHFEEMDKRVNTAFAQLETRLQSHTTLLWSLLGLTTGLVGTAFGVLWYQLGHGSWRDATP